MTRIHALLAATLLIAACDGPQGPAGPGGPPGPGLDRTNAYCDTAAGTAVQLSNTWTLFNQCRTTTDVPLFGACYLAPAEGVSNFFYLSNSAPLNWDKPQLQAGWTCTWSPAPGAPAPIAVDFPGRTEICCFTPSP